MDESLVSVVVRSMARPSLGAALDSIAAQVYPNIEVVLVAAAGPGHPVPSERCGVHPVRFVPSAAPLPRPAAANAGLAAAQGRWLTFLDDDDVFLPTHIGGLMDARTLCPAAGVIHCRARAVFRDGSEQPFGQPFSLLQLYERNFMHLSCAIIERALAQRCRFDEALPIHEDWDFFLQLAQHAAFHFVARDTFHWNADAGTSGAAGGSNQDDAAFARYRDVVYAKWADSHDALVDRIAPILSDAAARAARGDLATAQTRCRDALAASPNDPWALNLLASILRASGRGPEARRTQDLAVAVRPDDPAMLTNLALLCQSQGDVEEARRACERALSLAPGFEPAKKLRQALCT